MVGAEDFNLQCVRRNFVVKNRLRVKCAVIIADAGVVAADDEMRRPHVLPKQRVQHRLARARIHHVKTVAADQQRVRRKIHLGHFANRRVAHFRRNVAFLQFAEQHVNHAAVGAGALHGDAAQLLVREVHRVARLKGHGFFPAVFFNTRANLHGGAKSGGEFGFKITAVQHPQFSGKRGAPLLQKRGDARMRAVGGAVDLLAKMRHLGLAESLGRADFQHRERRFAGDIRIAQCERVSGRAVKTFHHAQHRRRPKQPVRHAHGFGDAERGRFVHKPAERREVAGAEHDRVGRAGGTQKRRRKFLRALGERGALVRIGDQQRAKRAAAVRRNHRARPAGARAERRARTAAARSASNFSVVAKSMQASVMLCP